jgi:single-strand selective monofunctional uracil DNA glycosylase
MTAGARDSSIVSSILSASRTLCLRVEALRFGRPVGYVYNPLRYARGPYRDYVERYGGSKKHVLFIGMNPGPWGMGQTGVPFGEVAAVRDWLHISGKVGRPESEHPRVPVLGFGCGRSEVSGRRLWGLLKARFDDAGRFFSGHFIANYCPLLFLDSAGKNITPDKLGPADRASLYRLCDAFLERLLCALTPDWAVGIGAFAEKRIRVVVGSRTDIRIAVLPHPSPASPKANRDWAGQAVKAMEDLGIW